MSMVKTQFVRGEREMGGGGTAKGLDDVTAGGEQPFGPPLRGHLGMHNTRGGRWGLGWP